MNVEFCINKMFKYINNKCKKIHHKFNKLTMFISINMKIPSKQESYIAIEAANGDL